MWHDLQWSLWHRLLFQSISQFLPKLSHNCLIRCSVIEFIKTLYYDVMLIIDNSNMCTLKIITRQQLTFFALLTESGYRHRRCHPPAFLIINLLRQKMQTRCPRLALPNKSAELHHLTSRKKRVWMWDKWWKIPPCGTFILFVYWRLWLTSEVFTYSMQCSDLSNRFLPQQKNEAIPLGLIYFISSSMSMLIPNS